MIVAHMPAERHAWRRALCGRPIVDMSWPRFVDLFNAHKIHRCRACKRSVQLDPRPGAEPRV